MSTLSILCPVDFSESSRAALRYALAIVSHCGAKVTVMTVEDPLLAVMDTDRGLLCGHSRPYSHGTFRPSLPARDSGPRKLSSPSACDWNTKVLKEEHTRCLHEAKEDRPLRDRTPREELHEGRPEGRRLPLPCVAKRITQGEIRARALPSERPTVGERYGPVTERAGASLGRRGRPCRPGNICISRLAFGHR